MTNTPALLAAAAGVGLGHAVLPDHWVPLAVAARTQRRPMRSVVRHSGLAGLAHVALSLVLGAVLIGVGLGFSPSVRRHEDLIAGGLLLAAGAALLVLGRGSARPHPHPHGILSVIVPFGAAASPDLTILPVFLAAGTAGVAASIGTLAVFGLVTLATMVGLTTVAAAGGRLLRGPWIDRAANPITAVTLLLIGGLVVTGII